MQITISEELATRLRQVAAQQQLSVEALLADRLIVALDDELDSLPTHEQAELRALHYLSNDALRAIAAEQMAPANQLLLAQLMERNSQGLLAQVEQEMLAELVERGDQLTLRKAEAAAILVQRGTLENGVELMIPHG